MILNPIICESCGQGLQPEHLGVKFNENGQLIRVCCHCNYEVNVDKVREEMKA